MSDIESQIAALDVSEEVKRRARALIVLLGDPCALNVYGDGITLHVMATVRGRQHRCEFNVFPDTVAIKHIGPGLEAILDSPHLVALGDVARCAEDYLRSRRMGCGSHWLQVRERTLEDALDRLRAMRGEG